MSLTTKIKEIKGLLSVEILTEIMLLRRRRNKILKRKIRTVLNGARRPNCCTSEVSLGMEMILVRLKSFFPIKIVAK